MDSVYANYIRDSKKFLKDFAMKKYEVTDKLAGVILSYSQADLNDDLSLFESLEIIITILRNPEALSLCYLRFFKSSAYFLKTYPTQNIKFLQIYSRICSNLPQKLSLGSVVNHISQFFCICFDNLLEIYARKLDFVKIIHIGRKNIALFQDRPEILNDEIFQNVEKLSRIRDEKNINEILIPIINLSRYLNIRNSRSVFLGIHLVEIVKIVYDEKITLQYFEEFSFRIEKIISVFSEDLRIELQMYEKETARKLGYVRGQRKENFYGSLGIQNETPTGTTLQIGYETLAGPEQFSLSRDLSIQKQGFYSGIPPAQISPCYNQDEFAGSKYGQKINPYEVSSNSKNAYIENNSYLSGACKINQNLPKYQQNPPNYPGPLAGYNQSQGPKVFYQNPNNLIQKEKSSPRIYAESQKEYLQNEQYISPEQQPFIGNLEPNANQLKQKICIPPYNSVNKTNINPYNIKDSSDYKNSSKPEFTREISQPEFIREIYQHESNRHPINKSDSYGLSNKSQLSSVNSIQMSYAQKYYTPPVLPALKDESVNVNPDKQNIQAQFAKPNKNVFIRNESPQIKDFNIRSNQSPDKSKFVNTMENNIIDFIEIIKDAIKNLENHYSADPYSTSTEILKNLLSDFAFKTEIFEAELVKCLKSMMNEIEMNKIDFWRYIIDSIVDNLKSESKTELLNIIDDKDTSIARSSNQCMRAGGSFNKRPTSRMRDDGRREIKDFTDQGNEEEKAEFFPLGEIPIISDYMPKIIPQAQIVNIEKSQINIKDNNPNKDPNSIKYYYETRKCSIVCEEEKEPSMGIIINPNKNYEQSRPEQKELKKEEPYEHIQKLEIENERPIIKYLTIDGVRLAKKRKGSFEDIMEITEYISQIKDKIQKISPSSRLKAMGSIYIGTHIKNSDVDILFIDYIIPNPSAIFNQAISISTDISFQVSESYILMSQKNKPYTYRIFINDEISFEVSSLIKEYCRLDLRCADLIIIIKSWAKNYNFYGEKMLTGVHISILVILFLQNCTPPILPSLQAFEHSPKYINQLDTWFLTNYDFENSNTQSLGELILLFFEFLIKFSDKKCVGDVRQGILYENSETNYLFSMFHPFTMHELSNIIQQSQESSAFLQILKSSFNLLISGEKLSKIIPS
ncbi:hypothetical protein SteCoe_10016 [Stentor coeruleus]|uniref:Polymerase nucleotidyl transferase domain-containing protein n=1 Tax=Stentor coeruleus TaxID=5963 RepID=A0A1R2CGL4_9CILI|nr:hypothetical protein SteCoe_10016 [Stentor coeruleus]